LRQPAALDTVAADRARWREISLAPHPAETATATASAASVWDAPTLGSWSSCLRVRWRARPWRQRRRWLMCDRSLTDALTHDRSPMSALLQLVSDSACWRVLEQLILALCLCVSTQAAAGRVRSAPGGARLHCARLQHPMADASRATTPGVCSSLLWDRLYANKTNEDVRNRSVTSKYRWRQTLMWAEG
jgi:hypothetical protein